ncbi:MAG: hypothetical protein P8H94_01790 [Crocinitomicaceae bacterium]|nr:hypothetical protein [Crocinitomicaceae bacterium]
MIIFKKGILPLFLLVFSASYSQESENLIPTGASTVFSINNINLLHKISIDDLVAYDFMDELHQELFDGSTAGKTMKDAGIDFDQRLNIFYGKDRIYEVTGFSFGVSDKVALFEVFDDFEFSEHLSNGSERYNSLFNTLILKGTSAVLLRLQPTDEYLVQMTDSLNYYEWDTENLDGFNEYLDSQDEVFEEAVVEEVYIMSPSDSIALLYDATEREELIHSDKKSYWEIRDSIAYVLQFEGMNALIEDLIISENSLATIDERFRVQLDKDSEGIFFIDNSRNFSNQGGLWYFQTMYPIMNDDLKELYAENHMTGSLHLDSNEVYFDLTANYGDQLGAIYTEMNNNPLNKDFIKYIPDDAPAYFVYNVDLRKAYDKAYDILLPMLKDNKDNKMVMNLLAIQLLDKLVDKKALFGAYQGGIFGTFNGVQKVMTKQIEYQYDEDNFDYSEIETETEEDIPVFTLGFASERTDLCEMVLQDLSRLTSRIEKKEGYWLVKDAILESAPLYIVCNPKVLLISNDEQFITSHLTGYGKFKLSKKKIKKIKKAGVLYAKMDLGESLNQFPQAFLDSKQKKVLNNLKNNSGSIELSSKDSELSHTLYGLRYSFESTSSKANQFLDMINTLYILSK